LAFVIIKGMSATKDCPFCHMGDKVLKQNKTAQLFLSNPRKTPGHFLVTPKRHIEEPWELTKNEIQDIFKLVFFTEKKLIGKLGDGCDIKQNYRPFLKQSKYKIDHVHFHIIPRTNKDLIYKKIEIRDNLVFEDLSDQEYNEIKKLV